MTTTTPTTRRPERPVHALHGRHEVDRLITYARDRQGTPVNPDRQVPPRPVDVDAAHPILAWTTVRLVRVAWDLVHVEPIVTTKAVTTVHRDPRHALRADIAAHVHGHKAVGLALVEASGRVKQDTGSQVSTVQAIRPVAVVVSPRWWDSLTDLHTDARVILHDPVDLLGHNGRDL